METIPLCTALVQFFKNAPCRQEFQKLLRKGDDNWHMLFANCAVSFLDDFRIEEGLALYDFELETGFDEQPLIHYQGSKASLLMAKGEFEAAKELYEENIQLSRDNLGDDAGTELVRTLCYYGNLLRVMELYEASEDVFLEAIDKSGNPMYDGSNSLPWVKWQYAKLLHDMKREEELPTKVKELKDFAEAGIQRAYPRSQSDIDVGLEYLARNQNTMSKLYQSAKFRAEAQLQKYTTGIVETETLEALRELHPDWATLTYPELLQRIPY
jgi:tetratricopeptide (TPR) repeat protein